MCVKLNNKEIIEILKNHARDIEEIKDELFKGYFREHSEESFEVIEYFKEYIESINNYISSCKTSVKKASGFPFVIIESIVEVQDMDDGEIYRYRIVLPYEQFPDESVDCASCLSPLGRGLLLKRIGQRVDIPVPSATLRYTIRDIIIPEEILEKYTKANSRESKNLGPPTGTSVYI